MKKTKFIPAVELKITGVSGFIKRKVTPFGNSAKVNCPKEYLGKTVYLVFVEEGHELKYR